MKTLKICCKILKPRSQPPRSMSSPCKDLNSATLPAEVIDDIAVHMPLAKEIDRAALLPGMYLAWCGRLGLLSRDFSEQHAEALLRLHYNDGSCIEMFVSACGGTLRYDCLNERGAEFTRGYYSGYCDDWRATFGEDIYGVEDSWASYNQIAAVLTKALLGAPQSSDAKHARAAHKGRKWWKFWNS